MGSIQPHELSLNCRPTFIPRTISDFLGQVSMIENVKERLLRIDEYISRLDDEMRKIDAFKRELPLSMLLLNDAIVAVKEEASQCRKLIAEPLLEEFIPLKKSCDEGNKKVEVRKENDNKERMNWLSSVQLWSSDQHCPTPSFNKNKESSEPETIKRAEEEMNNVVSSGPFKSSQSMGRAFVPFKGYTGFPLMPVRKEEKKDLAGLPGLSLRTPGIRTPRDDTVSSGLSSKTISSRVGSSSASNVQSSLLSGPQPHQQQTTRKQRRCWSPELHRRFVDALQQLGGSQVATPKQIRDLMQVDGLTNDEVKSHLQKYRLHTRRLSATSSSTANQCPLVLWTPQDQSGESSKQSNSQSGSPQDPLQFGGPSRGTSMTGGDSMEDEDDNKSDSHSWKSHVHSSHKLNNV